MIFKIIKVLLITTIITSIIGTGVYKYYEGIEVTEKIAIELQNCKSLEEAVGVMEPYKQNNKYLFGWYTREYELVDKTLWTIDIMYFGATNKAQILEEKPENVITIDSQDLDRTKDLLRDNHIKYYN